MRVRRKAEAEGKGEAEGEGEGEAEAGALEGGQAALRVAQRRVHQREGRRGARRLLREHQLGLVTTPHDELARGGHLRVEAVELAWLGLGLGC